MTRLCSLLALLVTAGLLAAVAGCSAPTSSSPDDIAGTASSEDELRSVATAFFEREPLGGARLETLRREASRADDGYAWTRNQGSVFAMQWETKQTGALGDADRLALAQAAFTFHLRLGDPSARNRRYLGKLEVVPATDAGLDAALDHVGLSASSGDASTLAERTKILSALRAAAHTRSVTLLKGELHYQVDMYWESALVVLDEENHQLLVVTGGYGT
jgi:hypothetical protein